MSNTTIILDFGANRTVQNKRVFSNSLEDQFRNLPLGDDYEDFIRTKFIRNDCKVLISYPNFKRKLEESKNGKNYRNIALRFPNMEDEGRDVVLMCDIFEKDPDPRYPERPIFRRFQVKSILLMDPNITHFGEIERTCDVIVNLREKEFLWESEAWAGKWPSDEILKSNILSNDFLLELNKKYVVQSPEKVKTELNNWKRYIESREYIIEADARNGYELNSCQPVFIKAYNTSEDFKTSDYEGIEHLDPKAGRWTLERVNAESREAILMHIYIDVPEKDYKSTKGTRDDLKSKLDRFTRDPILLGYGDTGKKGEEQGQRGLRIADRRLYTSTVETVEPTELIESIEAECAKNIESAKKRNKTEFMMEANAKIQSFKNDRLPSILENYASEQRAPITNRISADFASKKKVAHVHLTKELDAYRKKSSEIRARIEALKEGPEGNDKTKDQGKGAADSSLKELESSLSETEDVIQTLISKIEGLDDEYDPTDAIEKAVKDACDTFRSERIAEERETIEFDLKPEFDQRLNNEMAGLRFDAEDAKDEAKNEWNIARFHLFFEVEITDEETIDRKIRSLSQFERTGLKLSRDFTGDRLILDRQKKALENLEEGYVLNPFLATFLFSPRSGSTGSSVRMDDEDFIDKSLNDSQKEAVKMAMSSNGLFLIQGPPGTGKTQVIAEISAQLARSNRKVLIASQNNKAVDNAFDRMPKIPSVRLLRVLSEKAAKRGNGYTIDELVSNFYRNLSESMNDERRNVENWTGHVEELRSSIGNLSIMYKRIEACRDDARATDDAIAEKEDSLNIVYKRKDELEDSNRTIEEQIEQKQEAIRSVEDLSDEGTFKMVLSIVESAGLALADRNDARVILKALRSVERGSIIEEYASIEEHGVYFEFLRAKEETEDLNKKADLNKQINEYEENYDFNPRESAPFLSTLSEVPKMDVVLKAKNDMSEFIDKKLTNLKRSEESLKSGLGSSHEIDNEIRQLRKDIENLKKDPAYARLKDAETSFDIKANEIYTNLRIPMPSNRIQVLSRLEAEKSRFTLTKSEKIEAEEFIRTYRDISKYISDETIIEQDKDLYNKQLLDTVNVFGMTCSAKASYKDEGSNVFLNERNIDVVIVDEVSKVPFVEILQPILFGKTVILVGDHRQLPPMFDRRLDKDEESGYDPQYINEYDETLYRKMYEESFFAKLFDEAPSNMKVQLSIQYRMHPDIMEIDNTFYRFGSESGLEFGGNVEQKRHYLEITGASGRKVIGEDNHVLFVDVHGREKKESGSTSYTNPDEAEVVRELLRLIDRNMRYDGEGKKLQSSYRGRNDPRLSVGVICAYADQAKEIRKHKGEYKNFNRSPDSPFMVKTVDDFQGDERDIIILSLVRSRDSQFLSDYRRINVAISRARRLLIIVGNKTVLERMKVSMDGKTRRVYSEILRSIERKDGMRVETDIIGGE